VNEHLLEDLLNWLMLPNTRDLPPLEQLLAGPAWMARAACRGDGTEEYIIKATRTPSATVLATCARCRVRDECLAYALAQPDLTGVWGGTTERERRELRGRVA
jgi:WhiB family redox-sensing transcriptional regulator